jgi:sugar/nucleoside kinase (ribokinase family)
VTAKPVILCLGRVYCDLIFTDLPRLPTYGTEIYAGGVGFHMGGGAFITAAHLAALGHVTALSAMLPPAPFGDMLTADLDRSGVDISLCQRLGPDDDPQITVALVGSEDRAFVTRRSGAAFPDLTAPDLTRLGVAHVHVGELATLVERPEIVAIARAAGATVSLDCAWDEGLETDTIVHALSDIDLFLPNKAELDNLRAKGLPEPFAPVTAVKLGAEGAMAILDGQEIHAPTLPVPVIDPTGAGDAFNAGFVAAWLSGADIPTCLQAGNAQGRLAVSQRGGFRPASKACAPAPVTG